MPRRSALPLAAVLLLALMIDPAPAPAQSGPGEGKEGLVELGRFDPRLKGHYAPKGFKVQIVAAEPAIVDPTGMAFDDRGNLYVAEWKYADHMLDTWDTLKLPEGGTARIQRRRKATLDVVKRLGNRDADGVYRSAEVVVDGAEMPASLFPWKNSLLLTCVGRLERWADDDGDGRFETRTILADGFCGFYHHWLSGMTLGADGWFYLTAGDNDNHVVGSDGSRVEVSRCGTIVRGRVDGSQMNFFAMGFRNPYRDLAFNAAFDPFHVDNDQEEGSKFQGVRLIQPVEGGDYGWRLRPGASCCQTDFDRGAVSGELPGKLPIVAKTGRGAPAGLLIYNGTAFPEKYRDLAIYPDVFRKSVRAYRTAPKGGSYELKEELTLMTADDDLFRPCQAVAGPDGAIYVLDWRSNSGGAGRLWGDGKYGRLYRITWEGDGETPALPLKENNWQRVLKASDDALFEMVRGRDDHEAARAQRELIDRAKAARPDAGGAIVRRLVELMDDAQAPLHARLLGLQGARQFLSAPVPGVDSRTLVDAFAQRLDDPAPEVRRLAAQALSWELPKPEAELVPVLIAHLNDRDDRALRDVALAVGTHGQTDRDRAVPPLLDWLLTHPDADVVTRDAFIRALERIGEPGVEAVAGRIRDGDEKSKAVSIFLCFRTKPAAERLPALATLDGLADGDRAALVRQFKDIPLTLPVPTQGLADWVAEHRGGLGAAVKVAALDVCRLAGNPASGLVVALLDDGDEAVRLAAAQLAGQSRPAGALEVLARRVGDAATAPDERAAVARALRSFGPTAFAALEDAYRKIEEPAFRRIALRALADADRSKAAPIAEEALDPKRPAEVRAEAIGILGETPQTALVLGRRVLDDTLGRADLPAVLAALRKYGASEEHRDLLARIDARAASGLAAVDVEALKARVAAGADPWAGLAVFLRPGGVRCASCHKVESHGAAVGPALTGVEQALSLDKLIESILEPSKEIKEGYESIKVATKDGRVLSGIKVSQDERVLVLKDANGQEIRVPAGDVEEQAREPISLMPAGVAADLAPGELADLLAFLRSKEAQATLRSRRRIDRVLAIGPFAPGGAAPVPLDRLDPGGTPRGQAGTPLAWVPLDGAGGGRLNLRGQFGLGPGRAYLAVRVRSDEAQDGALQFALDGPTRVYLNGSPVAEAPGLPRVEPGAGPLAHLALEAGWNTLVLAVDRPAQGEGQALLELNTPRPVELSTRAE